MRGSIYLSDVMNAALIRKLVDATPSSSPSSAVGCLSDRELEILQHIGRGVGTRQIAEDLHLSIKTVESHRANIKEKLGLKSAPELVRFAVEWEARRSL
jgi:DNA-binding NarL/FixJ family response regulator